MWVFFLCLVLTKPIWRVVGAEGVLECVSQADNGDHLLLEYEFRVDGHVLNKYSRMRPNQLLHVQLDDSMSSGLMEMVKGMCVNKTETISWDKLDSVDLSPLKLPSLEEGNILELEFKIVSRTTSWDFDIFEPLKSENMPVLFDFLAEHRGINAVDEWGLSSLMIATKADILPIAAGLINARRPRVDVNYAKASGHTALFYAVELRSPDLVKALLRRGADPNKRLSLPGAMDNTPLHIACLLEKPKHAELLIEYGASPYVENEYGQKPHDMIPSNAPGSTKYEFKAIFERAWRQKRGVEL